MTDNDIIKALKCCIEHKCSKCPAKAMFCSESVPIAFAIDLITRQKEENSNLTSHLSSLQNDLTSAKAEIERLKATVDSFTDIGKLYSEIKAEAIKECLQEVRKRTSSYICAARIRWVTDEIEKEMVGDV